MTGPRDYLLRVVVADLGAYEQFLKQKLTRLDGIASIESSFALEQVKYTNVLPDGVITAQQRLLEFRLKVLQVIYSRCGSALAIIGHELQPLRAAVECRIRRFASRAALQMGDAHVEMVARARALFIYLTLSRTSSLRRRALCSLRYR
jgi:hypothetical protein